MLRVTFGTWSWCCFLDVTSGLPPLQHAEDAVRSDLTVKLVAGNMTRTISGNFGVSFRSRWGPMLMQTLSLATRTQSVGASMFQLLGGALKSGRVILC